MESVAFHVTEYIGIVAFAVSGAMVGIDAGLDAFGVVFLAIITAFGGGMLRDVFLGNLPPLIFSDSKALSVSIGVGVLVFVLVRIAKNGYRRNRERIEQITNVFDAIGLAAFAVTGVQTAADAGHSAQPLLCISLGMFTCIGGGMLRDMLISQTPFVLRKRVYALAALAGSICFYLLMSGNSTLAIIISMTLTFSIRLLATRFKWRLPRALD